MFERADRFVSSKVWLGGMEKLSEKGGVESSPVVIVQRQALQAEGEGERTLGLLRRGKEGGADCERAQGCGAIVSA